jgi:hypothetical protein
VETRPTANMFSNLEPSQPQSKTIKITAVSTPQDIKAASTSQKSYSVA